MSGHDCDVPNCDGTRLGHALAADFPAETQRIVDAFARITSPEDYVMPENLRVDVIEEGRRLASQRDDLIAAGVDPTELEVPIHPEDV